MNYLKSILKLFSLLLFISCSKDDGKISFTLLQVNDVYEIAAIQDGKYGGMARLETVRQELLKEDKNTMLVIAGDFLNPSLLGTMRHEGTRISGKQMVEIMNAMNFEVAAFGNHEFDVKEHELKARLNESNFPWISANVFNKKGDTILPFYQKIGDKVIPITGSHIKEISDADGTRIKIGFISVCIPSNPKDFVNYTDMYESVQKEYDRIKDQADVVIGLTHVKIAQDEKIAELLPNVPLIMGGHEHTNKDVKAGNVIIRKADANAKSAYIHKIDFDRKSNTTKISSQLKEIDTTVAYNPTVKTLVDKWQQIMNDQISQIVENPYEVIYHTDVPLDGRDTPIRSVQTNLGEIITKSMSFSYDDKVDCAIVNGGSIRIDDELVGNINSVDIFRVLPYGGGVLKVEMKGSLLAKVLEYGEKAAGTGAYLQKYNIDFKHQRCWIDDQPIDINRNYTIAVSDFLMKGLDIPFLTGKNPDVISVYKPKVNELPFDIRKAVIEYLKGL
tara:strand:- start:38140 stop:39645 length:1506 start_codon:yes stop_codon:yes gene_type:complete